MGAKSNNVGKLIAKIVAAVVSVIVAILLLIFCCIGFFVSWDLAISLFSNPAATYQTVKSAVYGLSNDEEKIESEIAENNKNVEDAIGNAGFSLSQDVLDKLNANSGELSQDEIIDMILGGAGTTVPEAESDTSDTSIETERAEEDTSVETSLEEEETVSEKQTEIDTAINEEQSSLVSVETATESATKPVATKPVATKPQQESTSVKSEEEYNRKVAEYIAQVYVLKAEFTGKLSEFEQNIKSQYGALPKEERTNSTKAKIVGDNYAYVAGLEAQCDAQMKNITDSLSKLMKEYGKDASLVDAIYDAYNKEKELKKAYYTSLYK